MQNVTLLAGLVVMLVAAYLIGFGVLALAGPTRASGYLRQFASTQRLHIIELFVRMVVGVALVGYASRMQFGGVFQTIGGVVIVTTLGLAVMPWRWHRRFARTSVPAAEGHLRLIGIASIGAGAFVIWALAVGFNRS